MVIDMGGDTKTKEQQKTGFLDANEAKEFKKALNDIADMLNDHSGIRSFQMEIKKLEHGPAVMESVNRLYSTMPSVSVFFLKQEKPILDAIDSFQKENPDLTVRIIESSINNQRIMSLVVERKEPVIIPRKS